MSVTAAQVKELRQKTGVGMMECKKALTETGGDIEKAILYLRERGMSRAAKKADRVTAEGLVKVVISDDQTAGSVVEVNCETDFVSKNEDFIKFIDQVAKLALDNSVNDIDQLKALDMDGKSVGDTLTSLIATIGENLNLRRVATLKAANGVVSGYTHMGGRIGTLVLLEGATGEDVQEVGKDLAMHAAAASPRYLKSDDVNPAEVEQEKELGKKKLLEQGKPENMIEKILVGQINKFYKEICLVEQAFVKDPNYTVKKLVDEKGKGAELSAYVRFQLGEGIEKKQENFAEEVAAQLKS
ncbi:translation elongation factor Ts [Pseudobacteriovorax antillogorgiicola]|uniref:Elongation factor Ts n=1 Tax=Pseudobacteriovorax antillogorgiicola TaxID=1513793 RepID=A0A1Y6CDG3_9BACT|nr:translation elongation factor Ts [Pseudobacteriovorax antillogorgiicola]TCS49398.1 translation elongation factor Ts (EF-Ts) [Pseudobacteriovorax antillogorgiicola]SMF47105.1 translation elongation factor Ts (EF-Ts) [Pseudobacteriovorax antillogorgiicola]